MALVHDLAEALTGDFTPESKVTAEEKMQLERDAFETIRGMLDDCAWAREARELWQEYTQDETKEANLVKDLDKFEFALQTWEYASRALQDATLVDKLGAFWRGAQAKIRTPEMLSILAAIPWPPRRPRDAF